VVSTLLAACGRHEVERPNVVIVVIDTLRVDHVSHFGYERDTAAGLDRLAGQSTRFSACYAPTSWTTPSTATIFTGMSPIRHGARAKGDKLSDEVVTFAELLGAHGWNTVGYSFNHNVSAKNGFDQGFDLFDCFLGGANDYPDISEMVERTSTWLESRPQEPFLLYLHPMNVHGPYKFPKAHRSTLLGHPPGREFRYHGEVMKAVVTGKDLSRRDDATSTYLRSLRDKYDTAIRYTTDQLGQLFSLLEEKGLWENSLVIVTADHGEELFDHGGFSHGYSLFEEVLRVPLYIKLPSQQEGRSSDARVSIMDIVPTLADLLKLEVKPGQFDGRSLALQLHAGSAGGDTRDLLFTQDWPGRCVARAFVQGTHKLIEVRTNYEGLKNVIRLYDLEQDPMERNDLSESLRSEARRLGLEMRDRMLLLEARAVSGTENVLDEMDQERLKALGYL